MSVYEWVSLLIQLATQIAGLYLAYRYYKCTCHSKKQRTHRKKRKNSRPRQR